MRRYSKGQKNNFRDGEAIAEAVQRPTMKFVVTNLAEFGIVASVGAMASTDCSALCHFVNRD